MPDNKTKLIAGESFSISQPYDEGHVLTGPEAKALNQTRAENIGNNLREAVKEALAKRDGGDTSAMETLNELVAKYDTEYTFAQGGGGVSTRRLDPVEREAKAIATEIIKSDLASKGRKWNQVPEGLTEEEWVAKRDSVLESQMAREDVLKLAKKRVSERAKLTDGGIEALDLG
jgi:hypothetical protein